MNPRMCVPHALIRAVTGLAGDDARHPRRSDSGYVIASCARSERIEAAIMRQRARSFPGALTRSRARPGCATESHPRHCPRVMSLPRLVISSRLRSGLAFVSVDCALRGNEIFQEAPVFSGSPPTGPTTLKSPADGGRHVDHEDQVRSRSCPKPDRMCSRTHPGTRYRRRRPRSGGQRCTTWPGLRAYLTKRCRGC
jgi:hypothetical protein